MTKNLIFGTICLLFITELSYAKGILTTQYLNRVNKPLNSEKLGDYFFEFQVLEKADFTKHDMVVDVSIRHYPDTKATLYSPSEFYFSSRFSHSHLSLGRKILNWDSSDKIWGLGYLNPQRSFNLVELRAEGVSGLHLDYKEKNFRVSSFISYLHIPQINPTFKNKNGEIDGLNEWSNPPFKKVKFQNIDNIPVYYEIETPEVSEIIFQPAFGVYSSFDFKMLKPFGYYTYKPENTIRINATGYYEQSDIGQANVFAKPFISHHHIAGVGVTYKISNNINFDIQAQRINPVANKNENFEFGALKIQPVYIDESFIFSNLSYSTHFLEMTLSTVKLIEGDISNSNTFSKKVKWKEAIGIKGLVRLTDKISLDSMYRYDLKLKDSLVTANFSWLFLKHLSGTVGLMVLKSPNIDSYWAPYRSNDSFYSRISYLF